MNQDQFGANEKSAIIDKVKLYFLEKLDQEIGGFDAEFLIDFLAEEIGPHFYNLGLRDAQTLFSSKLEEASDSICELEKTTQRP